MLVLIAGGGSVGRHMASRLAASGHEIRVIDNDLKVVESRSKQVVFGVTAKLMCSPLLLAMTKTTWWCRSWPSKSLVSRV
jgi:nucleoside-diphosphate-sugar epimerase